MIEEGVLGGAVADEDERIELRKGFEVAFEFCFGIFAGGIEGRGIGIAECSEMNRAELSRAGVHVFETESVTKGVDVTGGFVVTGNHENTAGSTP